MHRNRVAVILLLGLFTLLWPVTDSEAYSQPTHRQLSNIAVKYAYLSTLII